MSTFLLLLCFVSGFSSLLILAAEALAARAERRLPRPPWRPLN
jgi:hypothetical protein